MYVLENHTYFNNKINVFHMENLPMGLCFPKNQHDVGFWEKHKSVRG